MKLDKRLKSICDLVVKENVVADVGTDHGKVVTKLFLDNKIEFAYVTDISKPSVLKAKRLLEDSNIDNSKYQIVVTDGLQNIDTKHIDLVLIAGMGGLEIIKILQKNNIDVDKFILAPNNNVIATRKYLNKNKYKILTDFVVQENKKYYNIIKVEKGKQKLTNLQLYFGLTNFTKNSNDFNDFLDYMEQKMLNLQDRLPYLKRLKCKRYLKLILKAKNKLKGLDND